MCCLEKVLSSQNAPSSSTSRMQCISPDSVANTDSVLTKLNRKIIYAREFLEILKKAE